ncbi:MAG: nucleotidyl transferase AbiEii/AbiGii toxin family protein [Patescibacteria group bacterium]|nr:nucleotidyl transferase AbiEii/AbiGii toxin family protein [Patescibacteria group bacterium]
MEKVKIFLKNLISKSISKNKLFKRNLLKEYLQLLVLDFIYSQPKYSQLIFYGGSCLCHCFGLPRLSEDLDFVDLKKRVKIENLAKDLENFFKKNTDLNLTTSFQKFRVILKFPILWELNLAKKSESNLLFLKIEVFRKFDFCKNYQIEILPLFKFNKSILVKTLDLPTLMATKIGAIFYRKWGKTNKKGRVLIKVKGRDYFDFVWYLEKGIKPNLKCVFGLKNKSELKKKLSEIVAKVDEKSIRLDLEPLIENKNFVKNLSRNLKEILKREIERL